MLEEAIHLASTQHEKQKDRAGKPYFEHLKRVWIDIRDNKGDLDLQVIAWLHDICEDTKTTIEEIEIKFGARVAFAVMALTKVECESYSDYLNRVAMNEDAILVKLADLRDNMDLSRLPNITEADLNRNDKYRSAFHFLKLKLNRYE